jgi:putative ABC transport system ATP-binding protein
MDAQTEAKIEKPSVQAVSPEPSIAQSAPSAGLAAISAAVNAGASPAPIVGEAEPVQVKPAATTAPPDFGSSIKPIIRTEKLNVIYSIGISTKVHVLKDIDMEIFPGEFVIFYGPSGCGKSTLLYSIAGLEMNILGNVFFKNKNIAQMNMKEIELYHQQNTGMIFQAYYLINSLTVLDNVTLPQVSVGARRAERRKRAEDLLKHFGVSDQAGKLPNELSGGQQQRVAICRALINDPEILLADEPVGNLDSKSSEDVMQLIRDLNRNAGKTIVLVTHNPEHLHFAHRVFFLKDGKIIDVKIISQAEPEKEEDKEEVKSTIPKDLELLARTFSSIGANQTGNLLTPFKAKQIVSEIVTGLTVEEISRIQKKVEEMLMMRFSDSASMMRFLDDEIEKGGMGFDKRTAKRISEEVHKIVDEIKLLERQEERIKVQGSRPIDQDSEVVQIRQYLLEAFNIKITDVIGLIRMNQAIKDRLENKIDLRAVERLFDLPVKRGGAGIDRRLSRKLSKRLELVILGKFK